MRAWTVPGVIALALGGCASGSDASEATLVVHAGEGGAIYVDARPIDGTSVRVSRGQHVVELRRGALVMVRETVEVWGAGTIDVDLEGSQIAADASVSGRVEIRSVPPGAVIEIDGARAGLGPLAIDLAPGPHVVVVWAPGYEPHEESIFVSAGGAIELEVTLRAAR